MGKGFWEVSGIYLLKNGLGILWGYLLIMLVSVVDFEDKIKCCEWEIRKFYIICEYFFMNFI